MNKDNGLMKEILEIVYGTVLTDKDVEVISTRMKGLVSYDDLDEESIYYVDSVSIHYKDIQEYIRRKFLGTDNSHVLVQRLADKAKENPERSFTAESILIGYLMNGEDVIKLENGEYVAIRNSCVL